MEMKLLLAVAIIIYAVGLSLLYNPYWVLVVASASFSFSLVSIIVAYRKIFYLAAEMPHVSLLAVTLGILLSAILGSGAEIPLSIAIGLALTYTVGYMIHRQVEPSIATSIFVGSSTSLSVIAAYLVLTRVPVPYNLAGLIIGDPLLASQAEVYSCLAIMLFTASAFTLTYHEQASIGLDRVAVKIAGVDTRAYDLLAYTLLGLNTVGMLKVTGYIMEHVFILMPPAIAFSIAKSYKASVQTAVLSSVASSLIGLHLSIILNLPPPGVAGLLMLLIYASSLLVKRI